MPEMSKSYVNITPQDGENPLDNVTILGVGSSWDKAEAGKRGLLGRANKAIGSDLDLIAFLYKGGQPVKYVGFDNTDPLKDGSITSTGDNKTGAGAGDDEMITANLSRIPTMYEKIVFTAGAFKKGSDMEKIANFETTVYDGSDGSMGGVATIMPSLLQTGNMMAICTVTRQLSGLWTLRVLDESGNVAQGELKALLRWAGNF